jgi:2-polyprenyl-3-methyl-5-hydroxy-6-metoxy-1,4-benzoquinol methylase
MEKDGQFDWILSYDDVKDYFHGAMTGVDIQNVASKVLVIGCGTSPMSECIARDNEKCEVVSIDNDVEVINHMRRECKHPRTKWYCYDVIEDYLIEQGNELDTDGYFDLVVDKGTFDAVLVEGATCNMLANIHRLLRIGGVYMLFSINTEALLTAIFSLPELQFEVAFHEDRRNKCSILLCRKRSNEAVNLESLGEREDAILDQYFQSDNPLVTPQFESILRAAFAKFDRGSNSGYIRLQDAYCVMFVQHNKHLCYTYDLFEEDLQNAKLEHKGLMCVDEAIQFLKDMQ